jgi:DNA-binding MarR family transcriptional regulator
MPANKSELSHFLPYLLNQAAELVSRDFQPQYKDRYGMLRTEWRVLFHLGWHGGMTATQLCEQASIHKTKISRAAVALEKKRFLSRTTVEDDRRFEILTLTRSGRAAFKNLSKVAADYDVSIEQDLGKHDLTMLKAMLSKLISKRT